MNHTSTPDQWYASWFDTTYYHILYQDRDYSEAAAFMQSLTQALGLDQNAHILDLACGRGRHSIFLNRLGYKVTGVDLSERSIAFAKAQLEQVKSEEEEQDQSRGLGPIDASRIAFDVHNMTQAYRCCFDAVFNLFTSFGYFDDPSDNLKTIQAIKADLAPGGYGVIDFMNVDKVIANLVPEDSKTMQGITFHNSRRYEDGFIYKDIRFSDKGQGYHFTERVSALRLSDFQAYFHQAGLELIDLYGSYQLDDFDPEQSDRLIMVLKNKEN